MKMSKFFSALLTCAFLFVVSGCATTHLTQTGFLNDYSILKESEEYKGMLMYKAPGRSIAEYQKFLIDPIIIYFEPSSEAVGVNSEVINELTTYFYDELAKALSESYEVVDEPGPGVLRIRTALTDIVPSKPYLNVHWSTKLTKAGVGGASLEAEFLDSVTQERIAAVVDTKQGRGLQYHKGFSKWGYTKDALLQWAMLLKKHLDSHNPQE